MAPGEGVVTLSWSETSITTVSSKRVRQAGPQRMLALYLLGGITTLEAMISVGSLVPEMLAGEPAVAPLRNPRLARCRHRLASASCCPALRQSRSPAGTLDRCWATLCRARRRTHPQDQPSRHGAHLSGAFAAAHRPHAHAGHRTALR